jgi:hypothetical protein
MLSSETIPMAVLRATTGPTMRKKITRTNDRHAPSYCCNIRAWGHSSTAIRWRAL